MTATVLPAPPDQGAPATPPTASVRGRLGRLVLGSDADPRWARPSLWALLVATAALYLTGLTGSGYANEFYAASVKSATQSWTALLWASLDSGLSITVDKPPAAIWIMGLSARLFGFSSASLLVPQALMGVATVGLVYGAVRRAFGRPTSAPRAHLAGLLAGLLVAATPVAALMFRFDNPDALLTLAMTGAAYSVVRAMETSRGRRALWWMIGAGWLIGLAFLTKMLQGLLVLPALGLAYLLFAPRSLRARLGHLLAAGASLIVSGGWLIALCAVWPASARPYIGGSSDNSLLDLALGYNGLGRLFGNIGPGGAMGGAQNTGFGGASGILRMFNAAFGTEVSWLLPAAGLLLVASLIARGRAHRTDGVRASLVLWGGWLIVTAIVFSFMSGVIHPYYAVALVPAIAAVVAIGGVELVTQATSGRRWSLVARGTVALAVAITAGWSFVLLSTYAGTWLPALRWITLGGGLTGALVWFLAGFLGEGRRWRQLAAGALVAGALASVAPSTAWTIATAASAHGGSIPTSGPAISGRSTGMPAGGPGGTGSSTSSALTSLLNAAGTKWSAAVVGDQTAAGLILSTNTAVYCIGGWSGSDNNVTLDQFKALVSSGQIHYFIAGGQMGPGGGPGGNAGGSASTITSWVKASFTSTTVGNSTVYDLTSPVT